MVFIHHNADPQHWAEVKVSGPHQITDPSGSANLNLGSVACVRTQPPAWFHKEEIAYATAFTNFNQGNEL